MVKQKFIPYMRKRSGDTQTPITLYQQYVKEEVGFLLESKEQPKGRYSFMGKAPYGLLYQKEGIVYLEEKGKEPVETKGKALEFAKAYMSQFEVHNPTDIHFVGGAVGTIGYDVIRQYEKLPEMNPDEIGVPDVHLMFITEMIAYDHFHQQMILIVLEEDTKEGQERGNAKLDAIERELENIEVYGIYEEEELERSFQLENQTSKEKYMDNVEKAKEYIVEGDIFQVVLSQRWKVRTNETPLKLYRRLRQVNPSPYLFFLNFGEYQVAGSSPEMLVEVRKQQVYTCPIAGTRKRGKDGAEDQRLAEDLLNDPKERAEHAMLVDLARNDMGRIAKIGSVRLKKFMEVHYYSHVMHLVSLVEGEKREEEDAFSILASFLPAGTLSGAPKIRAMEIIDELEEVKRGIYGGAVGYFGFDGDMDMCIAIRTMVVRDGMVYMQAGAGIVADSDPEKEHEESQNKMKALLTSIHHQ